MRVRAAVAITSGGQRGGTDRAASGSAVSSSVLTDRVAPAWFPPLAALRETRRFLGAVAFPASRPAQHHARVAIIHAMDHLYQLAMVVRDNFAPALLADKSRLQMPKRMLSELIEMVTAAMQRQSPTLERDQLQRLSQALAEHRRIGGASLLEECAQSTVESGVVLRALNGLRWLDAVGYHVWRAAHHLNAETPDLEDDGGDARDQEELRAR